MNEPDHFDELIGSAEAAEQEIEKSAIQSGLLPKDQWCKGFIAIHGMGSAVTGIKAIALPNSGIDGATAEQVAETFYDMFLEVPMLHFMLKPGGEWLGRIMVIGIYVQGMRGAIVEELAEKRKDNSGLEHTNKRKQKTHDSGELTPDQAAALTGV